MDRQLIRRKFELMGARAEIGALAPGSRSASRFTLDVRSDKKGEFFDIRVVEDSLIELEVIDLRSSVRHLLLMARGAGNQKFLCGHDERHWFVAAVPGGSASTVRTAMEALKPLVVRVEEQRKRVRTRDRLRRRNAAFVRQGEWFFVPEPQLQPAGLFVARNEPLSRGGGSKPHMCEFLCRTGGVTVRVNRRYPSGLTEADFFNLLSANPHAKNWEWRIMQRDPEVYVRGRVWHPDHKTVYLDGWHRVFMNTENESQARRNVVFLD